MNEGKRIQFVLGGLALALLAGGVAVLAITGFDTSQSMVGIRVCLATIVWALLAGTLQKHPLMGRLGYYGGLLTSLAYGGNYIRVFLRAVEPGHDAITASEYAFPALSAACLVSFVLLIRFRPSRAALPACTSEQAARSSLQTAAGLAALVSVVAAAVFVVSGCQYETLVGPVVIALLFALSGAAAGCMEHHPRLGRFGYRLALLTAAFGCLAMLTLTIMTPPWTVAFTDPANVHPLTAIVCGAGVFLAWRLRRAVCSAIDLKLREVHVPAGPSLLRRVTAMCGTLLFVGGWCLSRTSELQVMVTANAGEILAPAILQDERVQALLADPDFAEKLKSPAAQRQLDALGIDTDTVSSAVEDLRSGKGAEDILNDSGLQDQVAAALSGKLPVAFAAAAGDSDADKAVSVDPSALASTMSSGGDMDGLAAKLQGGLPQVADMAGLAAQLEGGVPEGTDMAELAAQLQGGDAGALAAILEQSSAVAPSGKAAQMSARAVTRDGMSQVVTRPPARREPPQRVQRRVAPTREESAIPAGREHRRLQARVTAHSARARMSGGRVGVPEEVDALVEPEILVDDVLATVSVETDATELVESSEASPALEASPVDELTDDKPVEPVAEANDISIEDTVKPPPTLAEEPIVATTPAPRVVEPQGPMDKAMAKIEEAGRLANFSGIAAMIAGAFVIMLGMIRRS